MTPPIFIKSSKILTTGVFFEFFIKLKIYLKSATCNIFDI